MVRKIGLIGVGGNIVETVDSLRCIKPSLCVGGYFDDRGPRTDVEPILGSHLGPLNSAKMHHDLNFLYGLMGQKLVGQRSKLFEQLGVGVDKFVSVVDQTCSVSSGASIGSGAVLLSRCNIGAYSCLEQFVFVLQHCVVGHHCTIGQFSVLASGVQLASGVSIGEDCYIGMGAMLRSGVKVGRGALIGMGAVVLHDVPPGAMVAGNPARQLSRNSLD